MLTMMLKSTKYQYSIRLDLPLKTAYFLSALRYQLNSRPPHLRELFARLPKSIVACRTDPRRSRKEHPLLCVERPDRIRHQTNFLQRLSQSLRRGAVAAVDEESSHV